MYRPSVSSDNARRASAPELPSNFALEPMMSRLSIPDRRPPASVPEAPRAQARAGSDYPMDYSHALVSVAGKWAYPLPDQKEVIERGENARLDPSVTHRFGPVGDYEYVMPALGGKTYIRNVTNGQCREVKIVPMPSNPWTERR